MPRIPISQQEFDDALEAILDEMSSSSILAVPGVYEALAEELNNAVLDRVRLDRTARRQRLIDAE